MNKHQNESPCQCEGKFHVGLVYRQTHGINNQHQLWYQTSYMWVSKFKSPSKIDILWVCQGEKKPLYNQVIIWIKAILIHDDTRANSA